MYFAHSKQRCVRESVPEKQVPAFWEADYMFGVTYLKTFLYDVTGDVRF